MNEADTCRKFVVPKLQAAGWDNEPHRLSEQVTFTDGRIIVAGGKARRRKGKRADYVLRYRPDVMLAVVEAKPTYKSPSDGLQQAKGYAETLGVKFAYASNGTGIVEFDYLTGVEREVAEFPKPDELWARLNGGLKRKADAAERLLAPGYNLIGKVPRYYQEIAINRTISAIAGGQKRVLLTMATGTGKTVVAFQICWKLWNSRWNRNAATEHRRPRILYLADRNILVDDPKDKTFTPFAEARHKIEGGDASQSREMYFSTYQAIAEDERRPGLYRSYPRDFFDLVIVDECHRGSARDDSSWREILDYFEPAYKLGLTATPRHQDNIDTYQYFGVPVYTYSLREGIEDGFLAPYRVHRVITTFDAAGWRPSKDELDRYGRAIPDEEYHTPEFERIVSLRARTEAVARHLTDFLKSTDRFAKTIVFCVDQEHADEMRRALNNLNADLVKQFPDYMCRVTADEGDIGRGHLGRFQDVETRTPVILTTSQLLTTGVDAPTCKNVVLVRLIGSMTEFKQIIGRGTRVRDDYGKLFFNILDYTGSATRMFADPDFDGDPARVAEQAIDNKGNAIKPENVLAEDQPDQDQGPAQPEFDDETESERRKFYFDGGHVEIAAHLVYELDSEGRQLRVVSYSEYAAARVRTLFPNANEMRAAWADPNHRREIIEQLEERGIDFDGVAKATSQPDADPFDLLCHLAYNAPVRTRRERAKRLQTERKDFFERFGPQARQILRDLLDKYADHGTAQFVLPDVLEIPPLSKHGNPLEIAGFFGGEDKLVRAVHELQTLLYAA
jgi:type I restriction enzyme R subunit